ncbi:MAG: hypothetical protein ACI9R8_001006 [Candidatus Paceibacteria bacterium]|jgi:hypothetical protein
MVIQVRKTKNACLINLSYTYSSKRQQKRQHNNYGRLSKYLGGLVFADISIDFPTHAKNNCRLWFPKPIEHGYNRRPAVPGWRNW